MPVQQLVKVTNLMKRRHQAAMDADYQLLSEEEGSQSDEPQLSRDQRKFINEKILGFDRELMQMMEEGEEEAASDDDET